MRFRRLTASETAGTVSQRNELVFQPAAAASKCQRSQVCRSVSHLQLDRSSSMQAFIVFLCLSGRTNWSGRGVKLESIRHSSMLMHCSLCSSLTPPLGRKCLCHLYKCQTPVKDEYFLICSHGDDGVVASVTDVIKENCVLVHAPS